MSSFRTAVLAALGAMVCLIGFTPVPAAASEFLLKAENLADLTNVPEAVKHLGLVSGSNALLGREAFVALTGTEDSVLGEQAMRNVTSASQDVAVGIKAMRDDETGSKNVAVGGAALELGQAEEKDTAVGIAAEEDTTGQRDTAVGGTAMATNTSGEHNTAVGYEAQQENKEGSNNTAMGYAAGGEDPKGGDNTDVGATAGDEGKAGAGTGEKNVEVGDQAGFDSEGSSNVFLGFQAGDTSKGSDLLYIANTATEKPLIGGNFSNKTLTVNGRLEPGEAAKEPTKPSGEGVIGEPNEISAVRKRSCIIIGNASAKKFKCEVKFGTKLISSVVVQKAESEKPGEVMEASLYKVKVPGTASVEVEFTTAPASKEELFVTVSE